MTPLLLLPGLDGTGRLFRAFAEALPPDVVPRVVAYAADRVLSLEEHAEVAARHLPDTGAVVLAESFSGLVALSLLARGGLPIRGVIFCAAFARPPRPLLLRFAPRVPLPGALVRVAPAFLLRRLCLGAAATREELALFRDVVASVPPRVTAGRLRLVARPHDFGSAHFGVPCWYLQATGDRLVPAASSRDFAERFERFTLERVEGPHFLLQARPRECARVVARIVRGLAGDAREHQGAST